MTPIGSTSYGSLATLNASRTAILPRLNAAPTRVEYSTPPPSTQVTLDAPAAAAVVYAKPKAVEAPQLLRTRVWASAQQDAVSALMARNGSGGGLADQWRGLGGALLSRFETTQSDYRQTMADSFVPRAADAAAVNPADGLMATPALEGVQVGAATASLKIQTRSGQTVELKIAVGTDADGRLNGLHAEVTSSGPLSGTERAALAQLADGLDQALEGLGQPGELKLDLARLMDYDSSALSSLELTVKNPRPSQALAAFTLNLGADQKTVALKGEGGEIALNLDLATPVGSTNAQQRRTAVQQHLQKFDAAALRSHADAALVALFKDAFTQLHATPPAQADTLTPTLARQVQPLQSGLMDFEARFSGAFEKTNQQGAVNEVGQAEYQLSQKTTMRRNDATGGMSIAQAQSEKLDAQFTKSRHGGMLDTGAGTYDVNKIQDSSTTTTLIETTQDLLTRAMRKTDLHQLLTHTKVTDHRIEEERSTPLDKSLLERLR